MLEKEGEQLLDWSCEIKVLHTVKEDRNIYIQQKRARLTGLVTAF